MRNFSLKFLTLVLLSFTLASTAYAKDDTFQILKKDMWEMGLDFDYSYGDPSVGAQHTENTGASNIEELSQPVLNSLLKVK